MRIILTRAFENSKATLGCLKIDGVDHDPIFTLENPWRANLRDSSIPKGVYQCEPHSGPHFKQVWELKSVPGRTAILIHPGNTEKDTLGCILLGFGSTSMNGNPCVMQSRMAIEYFRSLIGDSHFELEIR